ncbi:CpaD family pilus assembly protein [Novosphingobium sp. 9]|uniref:CpaD family pilus assembly protein n=1 Tax=Novosphingobium sp. 9 TaxID=2025349 RepID=UPI0021B634CD|nr:CpaD family pilus assembly protein [Novosphingobium sp. 9]
MTTASPLRSSGSRRSLRIAAGTLALSLALALGACGGVPTNRSLDSIHQPEVSRNDYTLDIATTPDGLAPGEGRRLNDWLGAMGVKYGDHLYLDDPAAIPAVRDAVAAIGQRAGITLDGAAPVTTGYVTAGTARVIITRYKASVPGCPDWKGKSDFNPNNATSANFGCAVNSNLAAMVANPQDLVQGQTDTGSTQAMTASKAIDAYRKADTTGSKGLSSSSATSSSSGSSGGSN